ncbi:MAG: glycosyltransferase family 2 protein [Gemmatimonadota bacterium]
MRANTARPIKVAELELRDPIMGLVDLDGYTSAQLLVRLDGTPLGYLTVPLLRGRCDARTLAAAVARDLFEPLVRELLHRRLAEPLTADALRIEELLSFTPRADLHDMPSISVAVCTRDRPAELAQCLEALTRSSPPAAEILVIDNAPSSDATERLVRDRFPDVRYVREERPGLDRARNRAITEARNEIIAFTDDDVVVDRGWVRALATVFAEAPDVSAVTGLVVPFELESEAQRDFEHYGGFGRGFARLWHLAGNHHGAGRFGTGANMAFRRRLFEEIGPFDPALDVGTPSNGGGDLEMYFRVLQEGRTLVYEPRAVVRHRHRREAEQLRKQMRDWGTGLFVYMKRSAARYPGERRAFRMLTRWWIRRYIVRRFLLSHVRPTRYPRELISNEVRGALGARRAYLDALRNATEIERIWGGESIGPARGAQRTRGAEAALTDGVAVRTVELADCARAINDVSSYSAVQLIMMRSGRPTGAFEVKTGGRPLSVAQQRDVVADYFTPLLIGTRRQDIAEAVEAWLAREDSARTPMASMPVTAPAISNEIVSIVVATFDRPENLRNCLRCLLAQKTARPTEHIVVDNHPLSGLTEAVVAEFPSVRLIREPRAGLSYARNAGIAASKGSIVVATDDDVIMSADWLDKLIAPFARDDVMIVTGNVLPARLDTRAERLFEHYGGLGRGFERVDAGGGWFDSWYRQAVPTWKLGATANAAFRAAIFTHPEIGMLDTALGAGSPTGCSEDTDLFYRVLAAGFTIVYEPDAFVWHAHRRDMRGLRRQLYAYSKGHVAYHLNTWLRYRDSRAFFHLAFTLPKWQLKKLARWVRGTGNYPLRLILTEIAGNLAGPLALWRARRRARKLDAMGAGTPAV